MAKKNNYTLSPSIDKIGNDAGWLKARNDAMSKGWAEYFHNGQRYRFNEGDEMNAARNNWRNRNNKNYTPEGLLTTTQTSPKNEEWKAHVVNPYEGWDSKTVDKSSSVEGPNGYTAYVGNNTPKINSNKDSKDFAQQVKTAVWDWVNSRYKRAETVPDSYDGGFRMTFGKDFDWNSMNDKQKRNYLEIMDRAMDPKDTDYSLFDESGQQVTRQGDKTLTGWYDSNPEAADDYMRNFRGQKWDTYTAEGRELWANMQKYYNDNLKYYNKKKNRLATYKTNSGTELLDLAGYKQLYDDYNKSLSQYRVARQGAKLIPRQRNKYYNL